MQKRCCLPRPRICLKIEGQKFGGKNCQVCTGKYISSRFEIERNPSRRGRRENRGTLEGLRWKRTIDWQGLQLSDDDSRRQRMGGRGNEVL